MLQSVTFAGLAVAGLIGLSATGAQAFAPKQIETAVWTGGQAGVIKVHTARKVHDQLHHYGYERVVHLDTSYRYGKPFFKFRACRHGKRYIVKVDYYGDIVRRIRTGRCGYY